MADEERPDRLKRVPWHAVAVFILVSFGLAWLIMMPLWMTEIGGPTFDALGGFLPSVMMFAPLVATFVVVSVMRVPRGERLRFLGLWPLRPAKRVVWFVVASAVVPLLLVLATIGVSALFGWIQLDLESFSGLQTALDTPLEESMIRPVVLLQIAIVPIAAILNAIPALGEEIGWRGWLLPALRPMGLWPALLLSGAIWGLWHAPVTLLGHNFNQPNLWGVLLMSAGCVAWGLLFGWVRMRSGSVWPAVIGHGALNASGSLIFMFGAADTPMELALVNPMGVSGWIVLAVIVLILALTGQFTREPQLAPKRGATGPDSVEIAQ